MSDTSLNAQTSSDAAGKDGDKESEEAIENPSLPQQSQQMIPIALVHKSPSATPTIEECSSSGAGILQLITGTNKVAPEVIGQSINANPESTATVGAVLMLIPKKSDAVCVDISADGENNCPVVNQLELAGGGSGPNSTEPAAAAPSPCRSDHGVVKASPSYDSYEEVCRICHDNPSKLELISPCLCKGSMSKVHRSCLERWLGESAKNTCEICGYEYNTVRKPKYKGLRSIFQWLRHPLSPSDTRNLFFDIACFFILTPLAVVSAWLCISGARQYKTDDRRRRFQHPGKDDVFSVQDMRAEASNATWTSVGLLSLTGTLGAAYSVWLFVAIKYHIHAWREWQQRNFTVTIVPFEDGCMGRPPPPRPPRQRSQTAGSNNNNNFLGSDVEDNNYILDVDLPSPHSVPSYSYLQRSIAAAQLVEENEAPNFSGFYGLSDSLNA